MVEAVLSQSTRTKLRQIEFEKRNISRRVRKLLVADTLKLLDFSQKDKNGFVEYEKGVFIRDITSILAAKLGMTSLHVLVKNDCEINSHEHITQSQTIMIRTGRLYDIDNNRTYIKGETFFINKNHIHHLKYFANSEYLITFKPQLEEENE